jgi:hypothetical protein
VAVSANDWFLRVLENREHSSFHSLTFPSQGNKVRFLGFAARRFRLLSVNIVKKRFQLAFKCPILSPLIELADEMAARL